MSLGEEHYQKIWQRKRVVGMRPFEDNIRVQTAAKYISEGKRLLDVGCGQGELGLRTRDKIQDYYGVDISPIAVELARQNNLHATKVNLNVEPLPFEDNFFEYLTCLSVLQFVYDIEFALSEFSRVLCRGGELLLSIPNMRTYRRIIKLVFLGDFPRTAFDGVGYDGGTLHYFCFNNILTVLIQQGFRITLHKGIFCQPKIFEKLPDDGIIGKIKSHFIGAEMFIIATKI